MCSEPIGGEHPTDPGCSRGPARVGRPPAAHEASATADEHRLGTMRASRRTRAAVVPVSGDEPVARATTGGSATGHGRPQHEVDVATTHEADGSCRGPGLQHHSSSGHCRAGAARPGRHPEHPQDCPQGCCPTSRGNAIGTRDHGSFNTVACEVPTVFSQCGTGERTDPPLMPSRPLWLVVQRRVALDPLVGLV